MVRGPSALGREVHSCAYIAHCGEKYNVAHILRIGENYNIGHILRIGEKITVLYKSCA